MQYYFLKREQWTSNEVIITGTDLHHIKNVMRYKVGDTIVCVHPDGLQAQCVIKEIDAQIKAFISGWLDHDTELPVYVTIAQGLPKGDKLDWIVQKATELGARSIVPFNAKRAIVKWDQKKQQKKIERLERIAKEASEQSHRLYIPEITYTENVVTLISLSKDYDYLFIAYEETARDKPAVKLQTYFSNIEANKKILIVIGPEGGLADQEVDLLEKASFKSIRLGPRILRTETASLYVLAALSYQFEERA